MIKAQFLWHPPFSTGNPGVRLHHRKWFVCKAYTRTGVAYSGRTLYTALSRPFSLAVSFLASFPVVLPSFRGFRRFLRFSDCPRVAASPQTGTAWMETFPSGLSEGVRLSSPWMETFPSHFWLYLYESVWPPFFLDYAVHASCSSSSPGALRQLPWGIRYSEQEVLFPEGSQVMVKELLKACPSTQLNPRSLKEVDQWPRTRRPPN